MPLHLSCDIGSTGRSQALCPCAAGTRPHGGPPCGWHSPSPEHPAEAAAGERPSEHVRGPVEAAGSGGAGRAGLEPIIWARTPGAARPSCGRAGPDPPSGCSR